METLSEEQKADFSILYGSLFSLSLVSEYLDVLKAVIRSRNSNHALNKVVASEKANDTLLAVIQREFMKRLSPAEKQVTIKAIEEQREFVYTILELDATEQNRVRSLIKKIQRGK